MNNLNFSAELEAHLSLVKVLIVAFYNLKPSIRQVVNSITENVVFKRDPIVRALAKENVQWNCRVKTLGHTLFLRQKILQRVLFAMSCSNQLIRYILLLRITICSNRCNILTWNQWIRYGNDSTVESRLETQNFSIFHNRIHRLSYRWFKSYKKHGRMCLLSNLLYFFVKWILSFTEKYGLFICTSNSITLHV